MEDDILKLPSVFSKSPETSPHNLNVESVEGGSKLKAVTEDSVISPIKQEHVTIIPEPKPIKLELKPIKPEPVPITKDHPVFHNDTKSSESASFPWPSLWKDGPRRSAFQPYKPSREPSSVSAGLSLRAQPQEKPASPEPQRPTSTTYMTNLQRGNVQTETVASTEMSWFTLVGRGDITAEQLQKMIDTGKDIDCVDDEGLSGLMWAASHGQIHTVQALLEVGGGAVQVDRVGMWGETALMLAANGGHLEVVRLLLNAGADVNYEDHDHNTALMCAVHNDHPHTVHELLLSGADICAENGADLTAFDIAVNQKSLKSKAVLEKFMYSLLTGSYEGKL